MAAASALPPPGGSAAVGQGRYVLVGTMCVVAFLMGAWVVAAAGDGGAAMLSKSIVYRCAPTAAAAPIAAPSDAPSPATAAVGRTEAAGSLRRVVVTPAGRRRYVAMLAAHLAAQRPAFDEWRLWVNTVVEEDVAYLVALAAALPWVHLVARPNATGGNANINRFFDDAADPGAMYLRLDDDVVWLDPGFVDAMFTYRSDHPRPFLVYGNIINNAVVAYLHQRNGRFSYPNATRYAFDDAIGLRDPQFAAAVHRAFLADARDGTTALWRASFFVWEAWDYERVSINAVTWLGRDLVAARPVGDEELWLSVTRPSQLRRPCVILGVALCAHFAFVTQRQVIDRTDILAAYAALAPPAVAVAGE